MGYANPVIRIAFPELTDDPADPIWVTIRNPRLMAPDEIKPQLIPVDENGEPVDNEQSRQAMFELYAKLIVGWRVYDPTTIAVDEETGEVIGMERIPSPATPQLVSRLPMEIINRLSTEVSQGINPQLGSANHITKTSSSSLSPSTTEPGAAD